MAAQDRRDKITHSIYIYYAVLSFPYWSSPRTLELFVHSLLTKTMQITSAKNAKTLSPSHMWVNELKYRTDLRISSVAESFPTACISVCRKQCILSESRFDFLKDLVRSLPDVSGPDDEVPTPPATPAPAPVLQISQLNTTASATVTQQSELESVLLKDP